MGRHRSVQSIIRCCTIKPLPVPRGASWLSLLMPYRCGQSMSACRVSHAEASLVSSESSSTACWTTCRTGRDSTGLNDAWHRNVYKRDYRTRLEQTTLPLLPPVPAAFWGRRVDRQRPLPFRDQRPATEVPTHRIAVRRRAKSGLYCMYNVMTPPLATKEMNCTVLRDR